MMKFILVIFILLLASSCLGASTSIFGKNMLSLFMLNSSYTNVNHGSYGSTPRTVFDAKTHYIEHQESDPDMWFRYEAENALADVRQIVANYISADDDDIVFVENASDAFNAVIKSFNWQKGDVILRTSISYAMVQRTIDYLKSRFQITPYIVNFDQNSLSSQQQIIDQFRMAIQTLHGQIKVACIDHISSTPHVIFPVKQLVNLFHQWNITVIVDGAHVIGQIPLNVTDIGADFYFSNFHKWAYAPKNAAFLYISPSFIAQMHPNIIGNFYGQGLEREFFWTGTRDFSSYQAIRDAMEFRSIFGENQIMTYMKELAQEAGNKMASIWNTEVFIDPSMTGSMVNVRIPSNNSDLVQIIVQDMMFNNNTYMVQYSFNNVLYARLSAQIYNDINDFIFVANTFLTYLNQYEQQQK